MLFAFIMLSCRVDVWAASSAVSSSHQDQWLECFLFWIHGGTNPEQQTSVTYQFLFRIQQAARVLTLCIFCLQMAIEPIKSWKQTSVTFRERGGAIVKCRALPMSLPVMRFWTPLGTRISEEILPLLNNATLFRYCVLGQCTLPSHASLDPGVNE